MTMSHTFNPALFGKIESLDLEPMIFQLLRINGWSMTYARRIEKLYRMFLYLHRAYPEQVIVPTLAIDTLWHHHILDTHRYGRDCWEIFGGFLHHFPYLGVRDEQDATRTAQCREMTTDLFEKVFQIDVMAQSIPQPGDITRPGYQPPYIRQPVSQETVRLTREQIIQPLRRPRPGQTDKGGKGKAA